MNPHNVKDNKQMSKELIHVKDNKQMTKELIHVKDNKHNYDKGADTCEG